MATTTSNKRKKAVVATVAAAALLLGGTFAWTSISQQALNESAGVVNVGGRLHDDFNGTNKDVYVENFTDPLDGGQPIYARVRLDEYMEFGQDAGGKNGNTDADQDGVPGEVQKVVESADIDDVDSWTPHIPAGSCKECTTSDSCMIHDHWEWELGGQTTYMPTFNKNKDSLEADINGTYHGTDGDQPVPDKVYYDDYVIYAEDGETDIAFADKEAYDGEIASVIGDEIYDDDTNGVDDGNIVTEPGKTHVAKKTADGTVITMDEWLEDPVPGNYWVYDTDGWAYWANPIMPGEATGLLLSNINMYKNPGEKCYYGINVVGQFATVGDWEYFNGDEENPAFNGTDNALDLLEAAANAVPVVTVERTSGDANVEVGDTVAYKATLTFGGPTTYGLNDFNWKVYDTDLNEVTSSTFAVTGETATLTIGEEESGKNLIVAAYAQDYKGAVGLSSLAVVKRDSTAPTVDSIIQTGQFMQMLQLSNVSDEDFPLTVTAYGFQTPEANYNDSDRVTSIVTIEKNGDSITFTEEEGTLGYGGLSYNCEITFSEGVMTIEYNIAPGESIHMGAKVTDSSGNTGFAADEKLLFVSAAVGCFAAGTQVATADGLVNIEDIKLGDMVYSVNMETGEKELAEVTWVQNYRITPDTYTIYTADEKIVTTYEHPFYVEEKQDFVAAEDLQVGDTLKSMNGKNAVIEKIVYEELDEPIPVYNFTVEGNHNYLVSGAELLVHNVMK